MVVIINTKGNELDVNSYRERFIASESKQDEIRAYVKSIEDELNSLPDVDLKTSREELENGLLSGRMGRFLKYCTYSEDILDAPYEVSARSFDQMSQWRSIVKIDGSSRSNYNLAKARRLGSDIALLEEEKHAILAYEEETFEFGAAENNAPLLAQGFYYFIKSYNRHKDLGLPTKLPAERKETLDQYVLGIKLPSDTTSYLVSTYVGFFASAKRAGLAMPTFNSEDLEWYMRTFIEQTDEESFHRLMWDQDRFGIPPMTDEYKPDGMVKLKWFIVMAHHLKRILGKDR